MKKIIVITIFLAILGSLSIGASAQKASEERCISLFNGKNFDGWEVVIDDKGTETNLFAVENEQIHVYSKQEHNSTQSYGALISKREYSNYILKLEYKWGDKKFKPRHDFVRDAGIIFHMHGANIIWPNGVECQIQEGDTGDLWAIGTRVSSTVQNVIRNYSEKGDTITRGNQQQRFQRFHRAYCWEKPGWNTVQVTVSGDKAAFEINGKLVNKAFNMKYWDENLNEWKALTKGRILLQAEGAEIFYRNITIELL